MKNKREQLAALLQARLSQPRYCEPSYAQQRMWYVDQLEPGNPAYNVPWALRLRGVIDLRALQQSLDDVIKRHEILRTTFPVREGILTQKISPTCRNRMAVVDLLDWNGEDRVREMQRLVNEEANRPFDLNTGPLLRAVLLKLEDQHHVFTFTMHHIICDGWSMSVLIKEFAAFYQARVRGQVADLTPMSIQYADFAKWQRKWLQGERLSQHLDYWRSQLQDLSVLQIPTDYPRPAASSNRGNREHFVFSADLTRRLRALSQKRGATLFVTLLAAFQWLLARYSGQQDIAVGTFIANRNRKETEGLIGFFVNQLVLRTNVAGNPTFNELLARTRHTVLSAYEHQDLPFEKLVEELAPKRDFREMPFFQVQIVLQNTPISAIDIPGLEISPVAPERRISKLDLSLFIHDKRDVLTGTIEYNTDIFRLTSVRRLLNHFEALLEEVSTDPDQPPSCTVWATARESEDLQAAFSGDLKALEV
jgi:hypothetical protein